MEKDELDNYIKNHIKDYLKEKMRIDISTKDDCGDFGYGDYRSYKTHTITVVLDDEVICENTFDTGG